MRFLKKLGILSRKDKNKLIERTCKMDAYRSVILWGESMVKNEVETTAHGNSLWYARQKYEGHYKFVTEHTHVYDYATSTFKRRQPIAENMSLIP